LSIAIASDWHAEESDIDLVEASIVKFFYGDGFTPKWNCFACGAA